MRSLLLLLVVCVVMAVDRAIIVVGSTGYWNYRHQAAAAQSYHQFLEMGLAAENIYLMMSDDIARNAMNPFPGHLYAPELDAQEEVTLKDYYKGVEVEYAGPFVSNTTFLNVLRGNTRGEEQERTRILLQTKQMNNVKENRPRRVIDGPSDTVYVCYFGYAAPGALLFPSSVLFRKDLWEGVRYLHSMKGFRALHLFVDGPVTRSLLPEEEARRLGVFVHSMAELTGEAEEEGDESSTASSTASQFNVFCPPNDVVRGRHVGACLGGSLSGGLWASGAGGLRSFALRKEGEGNADADAAGSEVEAARRRRGSAWRRVAEANRQLPLYWDVEYEDEATRERVEGGEPLTFEVTDGAVADSLAAAASTGADSASKGERVTMTDRETGEEVEVERMPRPSYATMSALYPVDSFDSAQQFLLRHAKLAASAEEKQTFTRRLVTQQHMQERFERYVRMLTTLVPNTASTAGTDPVDAVKGVAAPVDARAWECYAIGVDKVSRLFGWEDVFVRSFDAIVRVCNANANVFTGL